ncbi:ankyrin repeats (3 copies) domain-containing protein [Penicillium malachiteum]|uniref:Ankyrin repeats (3 copies) domain-containing protein n=1 Tax=Penicillium malachiteum TaxID=1324776 RepID=A0AAD6N0F8_9EURO|nr:ankyrin repeats (3 copies) domain-containing protein [Penicillium malachiteum]
MEKEQLSLIEVFEKAGELNLCPNRLWNAARENLTAILPDLYSIAVRNDSVGNREYNNENDHSNCTSNFCEFSRRDFTSVQQRHECSNSQCAHLRVSFRAKLLEDAVNNEQSTAWNLKRTAFLKSDSFYMAISHVWSDGTGTGSSGDGSLNECLFQFFVDIATQFQCDGIWWDTLCIPRQKAARTKAIRKIETAYENARFTLVHDCFLRNWAWDPESACFAILMSPWFSRGWTALELLKSPKVKVIFKGFNGGPLIKDLDEEILAKEVDPESPRKEASQIIRRLRYGAISTLNDLLNVLQSRSTSWPKDIHIIAALLMDIAPVYSQQDTYRRILRKVGKILPGHLFHNAVTMSNSFMWCPVDLMEIHPVDTSDTLSLTISDNGDIEGKWRIITLPVDLESKCSIRSIHGLKRLLLKEALTRFAAECSLLAECDKPQIERALVVREMRKNHFQYLAAVDFYQSLTLETPFEERTITILSNPQSRVATQSNIESGAHSNVSSLLSKGRSIHSEIWKSNTFRLEEFILIDGEIESPDAFGRRPLHLAAERCNLKLVEQLLHLKVDLNAQCHHGQTALHRAAWAGSTEIARLLLREGASITQDDNRNTPLHIAAQMGFSGVVKLLIESEDVNSRGINGLTPLHFAAIAGDLAMATILIEHADLEAMDDHFGWTPLHCASDSGNDEVVRLLLDLGADINATDHQLKWTSFHFAAMNGHAAVIKLLLERGVGTEMFQCPDKYYWTALKLAEMNGHSEVWAHYAEHDKQEMFPDNILAYGVFPSDDHFTPLHCRAINHQPRVTKILTTSEAFMYKEEDFGGCLPLTFAAKAGLMVTIRKLLSAGSSFEITPGSSLLHWSIKNDHHIITRNVLHAGVDRRKPDASGNRPIHSACLSSDAAMLQILLEAGTEHNSLTKFDHENALHKAARNKNLDVMRLLLEKGLDMEVRNNEGAAPLVIAADCGNEAAVQLLLSAGAFPNPPFEHRNGISAMRVALMNGHSEVVRLLLEAGADCKGRAERGQTFLHHAARNGYTKIVEYLITAGSEIMARDDRGISALHIASQNGHLGAVQALVSAHSQIDIVDERGRTPLDCAVEKIDPRSLKKLIRSGVEIQSHDRLDPTTLPTTTENTYEKRLGILAEESASFAGGTSHGQRLLHLDPENDYQQIAQLLIKGGAVMNSASYEHGHEPAIESSGRVVRAESHTMGGFYQTVGARWGKRSRMKYWLKDHIN